MVRRADNEVRLRLESGQAINLQLSGDMEGRTLQLIPAEDGMTDLVIGSAAGVSQQEENEHMLRRRRKTTYH